MAQTQNHWTGNKPTVTHRAQYVINTYCDVKPSLRSFLWNEQKCAFIARGKLFFFFVLSSYIHSWRCLFSFLLSSWLTYPAKWDGKTSLCFKASFLSFLSTNKNLKLTRQQSPPFLYERNVFFSANQEVLFASKEKNSAANCSLPMANLGNVHPFFQKTKELRLPWRLQITRMRSTVFHF